MKRKNTLIGLIVGAIMTVSLVGCSTEEQAPEKDSTATKVEENKEQPKEVAKTEETKAEEVVLVDDENLNITLTGKSTDIFGAGVNLVIENKLDKKVIVQTRETSVDGVMEEPILSEEIMPGKKSKGMMQFMNVTEIENLKNIEGKIIVMDENYNDIVSYDINIK